MCKRNSRDGTRRSPHATTSMTFFFSYPLRLTNKPRISSHRRFLGTAQLQLVLFDDLICHIRSSGRNNGHVFRVLEQRLETDSRRSVASCSICVVRSPQCSADRRFWLSGQNEKIRPSESRESIRRFRYSCTRYDLRTSVASCCTREPQPEDTSALA